MRKYNKSCHYENMHSCIKSILARYCMPTICKLKPSNLIHINKRTIIDTLSFYSILEMEILQFDCCYSILYENEKMIIILIYNFELLNRVLLCDNIRAFLMLYQYDIKNISVLDDINNIKKRYLDYWQNDGEFPHEVGVFLGYSLADVKGFINNQGKNYLLSGFWKVYYDKEQAEETFHSYQKLRENALKMLSDGHELKDIIEFTSIHLPI